MSSYLTNDKGEITHYINGKGHQVPARIMKPSDVLVDKTVRDIHQFATDLMSQIARFREHTYDDLNALTALLGEQYGIKMRGLREGGRGNVSFKSFDGLLKIEVSIHDKIEFGPELKVAKALVDEYVQEVSEGVPDELQALLNYAFEVDKQGKVNRSALYAMRRWNIDHPTWERAMEAVKDSQRVEDTRQYVVISTRENISTNFKSMQINLANAEDLSSDGSGGDDAA
ncbi:Protein of unknown function [Aliiroseovarius crassostreae]|uniref:Sulfate transporter n=1 Tax=Aliiroseovarius crassostreae TaxID=154981 RepID=A0A0P7J7C6_9RHOB|nr:DUF3164 family protein [Aliiroseovarius crassostreae]KPN64280.1 hypothetical protein AKJ29_16740 [Aliiroseovarius crassostreae]SFU31576.1 Protein of unknown function [Aliiroseovarius crassostreae]